MKIIFTKSNKIGSLLIRLGLGEPCSHVAFEFDNKLILHSSINGVELQWANTFMKHNTVVYSIEYVLPLADEENVYQGILDSYDDCGYDYGAYFYFAWCIIKKKLFGTPMPIQSKFGSNNKFLCTELVNTLPKWLINIDNTNLQLVSPYQLYLNLIEVHDAIN